MYVPEDYDYQGHFTMVMQMAGWPSPCDGKFPWGGKEHKISISKTGTITYGLQRAGEKVDSARETFALGEADSIKGK